jgi:hypothetical protein
LQICPRVQLGVCCCDLLSIYLLVVSSIYGLSFLVDTILLGSFCIIGREELFFCVQLYFVCFRKTF